MVQLDRWDLDSTPTGRGDSSPSIEDKEVSDKLPIPVMNNYFRYLGYTCVCFKCSVDSLILKYEGF